MTDLPVINQSRVKDWRQCQRKYHYRYVEELVPKRRERPLHLGSWVHACLEGFYRDGDWRLQHAEYLRDYENLFEEERLELDGGPEPLPRQVERIMRSYLWYYRNDGWKVIAVEVEFAVPMPAIAINLMIETDWVFKGKIDLIAEDADGLRWVVDHKTTERIPDQSMFHAADPQLILYPWAAEKALGISTAGVIYNYVKSVPPTMPKLIKSGALSQVKISTDYPTVYLFLRDHGLDPRQYSEVLLPLQAESEFLKRYRLPREEAVTERILTETAVTAREIISHTEVTRNVTRDCSWCSYMPLCRAELFGLDTAAMRRTQYTVEEKEAVTDGNDSNP